jgi:hypothetical protein
LSEVDLPPLFADLSDAFFKMGYSNYFVPKSSKISGSAIFYKKDLFEAAEKNYFQFSQDKG